MRLPLGKLAKTLTASPVPISATLEPVAGFSIGGSLEIDDIGMTATAGVQVKGSMSVKNGASFSGSAVMSASPLVPKVKANASVSLNVGGNLLIGPGVATSNAGVVAGVSGGLFPIDADFGPHFPAQDSRFNACAKAETITLEALQASTPYPGSPWFLPSKCNEQPAPAPQDSLLGPGVTKVGDSTVGSADQWGHVDGFVPGKKTWVLSTGLVSDAIGAPDKFASTSLNGEGDAELTALAGYPTHDAAAYRVTLVPSGGTLHVR